MRQCNMPGATVNPLVAAIEPWLESHMRGEDELFAEFLGGQSVEPCSPACGLFTVSEKVKNQARTCLLNQSIVRCQAKSAAVLL